MKAEAGLRSCLIYPFYIISAKKEMKNSTLFTILAGVCWGTNSLLGSDIAINIMQALLGSIAIYRIIKEIKEMRDEK